MDKIEPEVFIQISRGRDKSVQLQELSRRSCFFLAISLDLRPETKPIFSFCLTHVYFLRQQSRYLIRPYSIFFSHFSLY